MVNTRRTTRQTGALVSQGPPPPPPNNSAPAKGNKQKTARRSEEETTPRTQPPQQSQDNSAPQVATLRKMLLFQSNAHPQILPQQSQPKEALEDISSEYQERYLSVVKWHVARNRPFSKSMESSMKLQQAASKPVLARPRAATVSSTRELSDQDVSEEEEEERPAKRARRRSVSLLGKHLAATVSSAGELSDQDGSEEEEGRISNCSSEDQASGSEHIPGETDDEGKPTEHAASARSVHPRAATFSSDRGMGGYTQDESDEEPQPPTTQFPQARRVTISSPQRSIDRMSSDFDNMYASESGDDSNAKLNDVFESTPVHSTVTFKLKSAFGSSTSSAFGSTQPSKSSPMLGKAPPQLVARAPKPTALDDASEDNYDPLGPQALAKVERKWNLPTLLVCRADECNPTGPFTPETTPTHHLYTYQFPADIGASIPPPTKRIIFQVGRCLSMLGAPITSRHVGFGHIVARGPEHQLSGVEKGVAYWDESRQYWIRLPWKSHYIPEAERLDPHDAYQLTTDAVVFNSFFANPTVFRIDRRLTTMRRGIS
ncbi:hypothetical protein EST38_g12824 [Candolleomyces aberdarensis]|uniref:Uncharacterized protein n=1 Tax=Candolleomyces aberdarensis TaxID=2316362 RepID=A0A4Q2D2L8_9AGAR|nr:hypothetical protein EST38_g12824 [Candolleomyces aberdarensis]